MQKKTAAEVAKVLEPMYFAKRTKIISTVSNNTDLARMETDLVNGATGFRIHMAYDDLKVVDSDG